MGALRGANGLQGQPAVGAHAPVMAGPNFTLSCGYDPAIISAELGAENEQFQPILTLTWPGHAKAGAKQPT